MAEKKRAGGILIAAGILILILFLTADHIGLGRARGVFGLHQIGGAVLGAILLVIGLVRKTKA